MDASLREEGYQLPDLCNMLAALTKKGLLSKRRDMYKMNMDKKLWFKRNDRREEHIAEQTRSVDC